MCRGTTITVAQALANAATCSWCGTRMWPSEQLDAHMARHELKHLRYLGLLAEVQRAFRNMRHNPAWDQEAA